MANSRWVRPVNGRFTAASNWSNGTPGTSDTAIFATGSADLYTVTSDGAATGGVVDDDHVNVVGSFAATSLTIDRGAVLGFVPQGGGASSSYDLGTLTNLGTLDVLSGLDWQLSSDTTVTNLSDGTLRGGTWAALGANTILALNGGPITTLAATVRLSGSRADLTSGSVTLENSLTTVASGGRLVLDDSFFSSPYAPIEVQRGGAIALGSASLDALDGLILDDGARLGGNGTVNAGIEALAGSVITASGGTLFLEGSRSTFAGLFAGDGMVALSSSADEIQAGASIRSAGLMLSNSQVTLDENLAYAGTFEMFLGTLDLGGHRLTLTSDAELRGGTIENGTVVLHGASIDNQMILDTPLANDGTTLAFGGALQATRAVTGSGTFQIGAGGSVAFGGPVAATQTVTFLDATGTLILHDASAFKGAIASFQPPVTSGSMLLAPGDAVDLTGFAVSGEKLFYTSNSDRTGGVIVIAGAGKRASLHLEGQYSAAGFHIATDQAGTGTVLTYAPAIHS